YYDSMSVVPSLAPGAQTTAGIASMLELARLLRQPEFRPSRSVLFLATGSHFQGLGGMRAFMEGLSQDNVETMRELRRDLNQDVLEFQALGRKMALSIDRGYLVEFPPAFFHRVDSIATDLDSVIASLNDLDRVQKQVDRLAEAQRVDKEEARKRKIADLSKNRDTQNFTEEERALLDVHLARAEFLGLQTAQFLKDLTLRIGDVKVVGLRESRATVQQILTEIAVPIAQLDVWAMQEIRGIATRGEVGEGYSRLFADSLLPYTNRDERPAGALSSMAPLTIPGFGELDPAAAFRQLEADGVLDDWEVEKGRIATLYIPDKVLGRHLAAVELGKLRRATKTLSERQAGENYADTEQALLDKVLASSKTYADAASDVVTLRAALNSPRYQDVRPTLERYLTPDELRAAELSHETLKDGGDLAIEEFLHYINIAERRLEQEAPRLQTLLQASQAGMLDRDFRAEELLVLANHMNDADYDRLLDARSQVLSAYQHETYLVAAERRARNDVLELLQLHDLIPTIERTFTEGEKRLLRTNMMTMRNSRVRNVHKRIERLSRIDPITYQERVAGVIQS
ncbi:MAG: M28 family peptidase, partial [Candidatus Poribacteria bacterium]